MSKNTTDDFLTKFANRVEKVGRDGVMGLMKSTGLPINNIKYNYDNTQNYQSLNYKNDINEANKSNNNNDYNISPFRSQKNLYINNTYKSSLRNSAISNINNFSNINNNKYSTSKSVISSKNFNQNNRNNNDMFSSDINYNNNINNNSNNYNDNIYFNSRSSVRSNSINYRYNNNINNNLFSSQSNNQRNIYSVANNRQNIVDYGYTPYTLKDYKKITNDVKLGKLGPNIGTEEWKKKRKKMKKMSEYGNKVMSEGKGCYVKLAETADERHKRLQEMKLLNGKWNIINEYSRGIMLNKDKNSNEQFKRNVNDKLNEEERLIDNQFELDMEQEEEEERILQQKRNALYQQRLNRMKNLLFN